MRFMRVLGINAFFHDPAAALVVDGEIVAAAEEERFSRRKHGKRPVPFSAWELPELAAALVPRRRPGSRPDDLDAVAYSYDPALRRPGRRARPVRPVGPPAARCTPSGRRASWPPRCPGLDPAQVRFVPHHVAHAASAGAGRAVRRRLRGAGARRPRRARTATSPAATRRRGWRCSPARRCRTRSGCSTRTLTEHLGFLRSSDEYKVMALASYGTPRYLDAAAASSSTPPATAASAPSRSTGPRCAKRAAADERAGPPSTPTWPPACRRVLEEVLLELAGWLHERPATGRSPWPAASR